jgi:hypothetical protein
LKGGIARKTTGAHPVERDSANVEMKLQTMNAAAALITTMWSEVEFLLENL